MEPLMGVDVGQKHDPTTIAVAEVEMRPHPLATGREEAHFLVRYLARLDLGLSYPLIARRIVDVTAGVVARAGEPTLYLDITGVGAPLLDLLRSAGTPARLVGVFFVAGERRLLDPTSGDVRLGKAYAVGRLQALLQAGRVHLPDTAEARATGEELLAYEVKVTQDGADTYGARTGKHDDLVTALALATQVDPPPAAAGVEVPREETVFSDSSRRFWGRAGSSGGFHRRGR